MCRLLEDFHLYGRRGSQRELNSSCPHWGGHDCNTELNKVTVTREVTISVHTNILKYISTFRSPAIRIDSIPISFFFSSAVKSMAGAPVLELSPLSPMFIWALVLISWVSSLWSVTGRVIWLILFWFGAWWPPLAGSFSSLLFIAVLWLFTESFTSPLMFTTDPFTPGRWCRPIGNITGTGEIQTQPKR